MLVRQQNRRFKQSYQNLVGLLLLPVEKNEFNESLQRGAETVLDKGQYGKSRTKKKPGSNESTPVFLFRLWFISFWTNSPKYIWNYIDG